MSVRMIPTRVAALQGRDLVFVNSLHSVCHTVGAQRILVDRKMIFVGIRLPRGSRMQLSQLWLP